MLHKIISHNCDRKYINKFKILKAIIRSNQEQKDDIICVALLQEATPFDLKKDKNLKDIEQDDLNQIGIISNNKNLVTIINKKFCMINDQLETDNLILTDNVASAIITKLKIKNINEPLIIINLYIRPPKYDPDQYDIYTFLNEIKEKTRKLGWSRILLMGDVNGVDPLWCPGNKILTLGDRRNNDLSKSYLNRCITRGRAISGLFKERMNLRCMNNIQDGPTWINNTQNTSAYIDICLVGEKTHRKWKTLELHELNNQTDTIAKERHKILTLICKTTHPKEHMTTMNYKKDRPNHEEKAQFNRKLREHKLLECYLNLIKIRNEYSICEKLNRDNAVITMNKLSDALYEYIFQHQQVLHDKTNKKTHYKLSNKAHTRFQKEYKLAKKLKKLKRNSKKYHIIRDKITRYIRNDIDKANNIDNNELVTRKKTDIEERWQDIHKLEGLIELTNKSSIDQDKNKHYYETLDSIAEMKFPNDLCRRNELNKTLEKFWNQTNKEYKLSDEEIELVLYEMRKKRYKDLNGIRFEHFINIIKRNQELMVTLKIIMKLSRHLCIIPNVCKTNLGKIIPKKMAGKFRIVHLSTPLSCLIEQTILHELEMALEYYNRIDKQQYGFTKLRDRHDMITKIIADTIYNKSIEHNKNNTIIVSLDVRGAFDNVDQAILIQKMYSMLCNKNEHDCTNYIMMVKWIGNFLLKKQVVLDYNQKRSSTRQICQGVPQGSCLGPILWNFMIENITTTFNNKHNSPDCEILSYADDIVMCIRNIKMRSKQTVQMRIDEFIHELNRLKLDVDPDKCNMMLINVEKRIRDKMNIRINDTNIQIVKEICILGVKFDNTLRLNMDSITKNDKLATNVYLLQRLTTLNILQNNEEYKTIISSLIKSILLINNFPILAIDSKSRAKVEKEYMKIIKYIFSWNPYVSNKVVKMIFMQESFKNEIEKLIYKKEQYETGSKYKIINQILQRNLDVLNKNSNSYDEIRHYENHHAADIDRRVGNPKKLIKFKTIKVQHRMKILYFWYIKPTTKMALAMLMRIDDKNKLTIMRKYKIMRLEYKNSYFNQLSTIYELCRGVDTKTQCKNITINTKNGLFQALRNFNNTDHRVIKLRETIIDNDMKIYAIDDTELTSLIDKNISLMNHTTMNTIISKWPKVEDYIINNRRKKAIQSKNKMDYQQNINSFCSSISNNVTAWSNLHPNRLKGRITIMLSGNLILDKRIIHHTKITSICKCDKVNYENLVMHRLMECKENKLYRDNLRGKKRNLFDELNRNGTSINQIMNEPRKRSTLIKMLNENMIMNQEG